LTLAADRLTKALIVSRFEPGESVPLIPPVLHLTYVQNTGAAFGLFKGQQLLFVVVAVAVLVWVVRELRGKPLQLPILLAYGMIVGGALGNLVDRLRLGYVVDFIDCRVWPVFNIGDSAITIGVGLLLWSTLRPARRARPG
jgi:signal peptidase II